MAYLILYIRMRALGKKINASPDMYPTLKTSMDLAHPHIEYKFPFYYWVVFEKGVEWERERFFCINNLLYKIFDGITFSLASFYEADNRIETQDFRRLLFSYQIYLMNKLSVKWGKRLKKEIDEILLKAPYRDDLY